MNVELFKNICKMDENQLLRVMSKYLLQRNYKVISTDKYIIGIGREPITLAAHLDTVGVEIPTKIYFDPVENIMWSPQLLGADDRSGVYAIIQIIEKGYKPHVIFTTGEEQGCMGAEALVKDYPKSPFPKNKTIIQLDRRGKNDCVFYKFNNRDFISYIENFGFKEAYGTFTDITIFGPAWCIPTVNLSTGYENEHTLIETLNIKWLDETIEKVEKIILKVVEMPYFKYEEFNYQKIRYSNKECLICGNKVNKKNKRMTPEGYSLCEGCYTMCYG